MKVKIIPSPEFDLQFRRLAKKYKSLPIDYLNFSKGLKENPLQGDDLGGGVRKVRMAIGSKHKGKSGGARVLTLTVLVSNNADVTLLTIYDKGEIENVTDKYINWLVKQYKAKK